MLLWEQPVTDRSQTDVDELKSLFSKGNFNALTNEEQKKFLNGMKGAINISDLSRIRNNIELLAEVYEIEIYVPIPNNVLTVRYIQELLYCVETLMDKQKLFSRTPKLPSMPVNTYNKWNDIEKILQDMYSICMNNFYDYCGEIYAGDGIGLI